MTYPSSYYVIQHSEEVCYSNLEEAFLLAENLTSQLSAEWSNYLEFARKRYDELFQDSLSLFQEALAAQDKIRETIETIEFQRFLFYILAGTLLILGSSPLFIFLLFREYLFSEGLSHFQILINFLLCISPTAFFLPIPIAFIRIGRFNHQIKKLKSLQSYSLSVPIRSSLSIYIPDLAFNLWHSISMSPSIFSAHYSYSYDNDNLLAGTVGEMRVIENIDSILQFQPIDNFRQASFVLHGPMLGKKLDGDAIVITPWKVFLFESKYWRGKITKDDKWEHISDLVYDTDEGTNKKSRIDPETQYIREENCLIKSLVDLKLGKRKDWLAGGIIFTHNLAELNIEDCNVKAGDLNSWICFDKQPETEAPFDFYTRLKIADKLIDNSLEFLPVDVSIVDSIDLVTSEIALLTKEFKEKTGQFKENENKIASLINLNSSLKKLIDLVEICL